MKLPRRWWLSSKESSCNAGDLQETEIQSLGQEDSLGEGNGDPLQYYCLENPHEQRSLAAYSPWHCRVGHDWVTEQQNEQQDEEVHRAKSGGNSHVRISAGMELVCAALVIHGYMFTNLKTVWPTVLGFLEASSHRHAPSPLTRGGTGSSKLLVMGSF